MPMTLQDMRILVVDDSQNMRKLVRAILRGFGINQVDEASSGAEGLQILYDANPNVVITDLNMKPMDGFELVRIIRKEAINIDRNIPVIVLSGHADRRHVDMARKVGATYFVTKPIAPGTLRARLESLVG